MPDLRKVLDGLEHCARMKPCDKCPYDADCKKTPEHNAVMADALEMIRDQNSKIIELKKERKRLEAVRPEKKIEQTEWNCCPKCGGHVISKWGYCPYCGQGVKWE